MKSAPGFAFFIFLLAVVGFGCGSGASQATPILVQRDATYCVMDGVALKMDIYTPERPVKQPAVVFIHGGGWTKGNKSLMIGKDAPALNQAGLVVFSIDYRLGSAGLFPAMLEDVKCAVRSLRAHADEYGIDPGRIGAYGVSAGGHLAALLGVMDESAGFDSGEYLEYSSRVQAVAEMYAPTDLRRLYAATPSMRAAFLESDLLRASPIHYVSADDPPFLILHGTRDKLIDPEHSQIFYEALTANAVPAELIMVENGEHGFNTENLKPTRAEISQIIAAFFAEKLK